MKIISPRSGRFRPAFAAFTVRIALCVVALCTLVPEWVLAATDGYKLGRGDVIRIHVYGEDDLSFDDIKISGGGKISYPFLGEIDAGGLTVTELEQILIDGLKPDYLVDPRIVVSIQQYRQVYINGEVGQPGGYPFQPGLTLRKAISLAGGFTERASRSRVEVISENDPDSVPELHGLDYEVKPGDIITVKQSFF